MSSMAQHSMAERAGRVAGRAWRGFARWEQQLIRVLTAQGLSPRVARIALWVVKLVVFGALLYLAFWLTLLLAFAIVGAWTARYTDWNHDEDDQPKWRVGPGGFGLYRGEMRIDGGSEDDE